MAFVGAQVLPFESYGLNKSLKGLNLSKYFFPSVLQILKKRKNGVWAARLPVEYRVSFFLFYLNLCNVDYFLFSFS